ncbi:MAG TPA: toxin-antitoxin system YwqK family antitoxin [Bacteroidales bacterium]|nr:toxin-antitoxin system YwqK family antitoxin [Bacteroidales bacterium]HSA43040.1 toxin-antitoxin system YwqK family antitoxin [Bacteroidales bacterium]
MKSVLLSVILVMVFQSDPAANPVMPTLEGFAKLFFPAASCNPASDQHCIYQPANMEYICDKLVEKNKLKYLEGSTEPFTGICMLRYAGGQPMMETPYVNGLPEGIEKAWYENGNLMSEISLKAGKFNGKVIYYYEDGKKKSEETYLDDYKFGRAVHYFENGQKESEGVYDNCRETGQWIYYHPNGQKKAEGTFTEGIESGEWIYWDEKGNRVNSMPE